MADFFRPEALDDLLELGADLVQPVGEGELGGRLDDAVNDGDVGISRVFDDAEPGGPKARIDPQDPHAVRPSGLLEPGELLFVDVEVGRDRLDVVVVLELLDELQGLLGLLALDLV